MLRTSILNKIRARIEASRFFQESDFTVSDANNKGALRIEYRFDPKYFFVARLEQDYTKTIFWLEVRPGEVQNTEKKYLNTAYDLIESVGEWLERVREELLAYPVARAVEEQQRQLEEFLRQFETLPDEYFTKQEAEDICARLDDLQCKLEENIRASSGSEKEAAKKITHLQQEIATLKSTLESLKKSGWGGSLAVRLFEWLKDPVNQKVLTAGAKTAAHLMLGDGDSHHPST